MDTERLGIDSKLIHAGHKTDETGAVNTPIYQSSTFAFRNAEHGAGLFAGSEDGYIYTRIGNPTIRALEDNVAELECGCGGIATSSGMGAICTVYLALLEAGAHVVSTASVYGPTRGLLEKDFSRFGVQSTYVDTCNRERPARPDRVGIAHGFSFCPSPSARSALTVTVASRRGWVRPTSTAMRPRARA